MRKAAVYILSCVLAVSSLSLFSCSKKEEKTGAKPVKREVSVIDDAREAYIYAFPLVMSFLSERVTTNPLKGTGNAQLNQFKNENIFPDSKSQNKILPDRDTFYSYAWVNLGKEPVIFEIPDTKERYYYFTVSDAWSKIIASFGKRTSGTKKQIYLFAPSEWEGDVPENVTLVRAPTDMIRIVGRIQVDGKEDGIKNVVPLQNKLKLIPLSEYGNKDYVISEQEEDTVIDMTAPAQQIFKISVADYFNLLNNLIMDNPPLKQDIKYFEKFRYLKIYEGTEFDISSFDEQKQKELQEIPDYAYALFQNMDKERALINGWDYIYMSAAGSYEKQAFNAYRTDVLNAAQDYIYMKCGGDSEGQMLNGKNKYVLHFDKGELPPVNAFWSITAYNDRYLFSDNPSKKYSVSGRDPLKYEKDGSLDIYIQTSNPGKTKESNWLPVPGESFILVLRAYWPMEEMISGKWKIPAVKRTE